MKFRIGDRVKIIHKGQIEKICTIIDILQDYGSDTYWLKSEKGGLILEMETPETKFEKLIDV